MSQKGDVPGDEQATDSGSCVRVGGKARADGVRTIDAFSIPSYEWRVGVAAGRIFPSILVEPGYQDWPMLDATVVRAHSHAAGARNVRGGADAQGLGLSRGDLTTKIHAATDGLGLPMRPIGSRGHKLDTTPGCALLDGLAAGSVFANTVSGRYVQKPYRRPRGGAIGSTRKSEAGFRRDRRAISRKPYDKDHDADRLAEAMSQRGMAVVIPPRRKREAAREFGGTSDRERDRIERFFHELKRFRRVATRYDKRLANDSGFITPAAIVI